ncbi:ribose-5-phosphate isomerase RpiA [Amaricoccus solimangrovi]|uniref:Ribose-5-phosphate isomerase A n=1 Tax=Amaricoccus solimangrovi TaxID=2589815 RepID=A0A501WYY2_9RHOB|nr:ribose-5-phosphate isomerase RpiA [Amaricoccus solimangrovi]TPE53545.1 ribose-5-phosphate isomerase RpiA [Amaricoccus solimangrovi]
MSISPADAAKRAAAALALESVEGGMRLGIGTGSTAVWLVRLLAERISATGLDVVCVPTSEATAALARELGVPLATLDELGALDLAIDGADEFDPRLDLIKGGGGAHFREKIVAAAAARFIVIADEGKRVPRLGAFPLPVEVVRFGWPATEAAIRRALEGLDLGGAPIRLRERDGAPALTDEGNYILDLALGAIPDAPALARRLDSITGVVEHGLFIGMADCVALGRADGTAGMLRRLAATPDPREIDLMRDEDA